MAEGREPRIMLGIHTLRSTKLVELPSDRYRVAWLDLLLEAKILKPEGVFPSLTVLRFHAKHRKDCLQALIDGGLIHAAAAMCDRCKKRFSAALAEARVAVDQAFVMHDWHDYQVSRWTEWRNSDAPADAPGLQPPRTDLATPDAPITRAGTPVRPPSSLSEEPTDEGAVLAWLASVGATVQPNGNGYHREVVTFVGRRGAAAVLEAMKRRHAAGDKSARQLIFGAQNDLERIATAASKAGPKGHQGTQDEATRAFGG